MKSFEFKLEVTTVKILFALIQLSSYVYGGIL